MNSVNISKPSTRDKATVYFQPSIPKEVVLDINRFQRKQKKGTIDVWWLYDDGKSNFRIH